MRTKIQKKMIRAKLCEGVKYAEARVMVLVGWSKTLSFRPTNQQYYTDTLGREIRESFSCSFVLFYRENERTNTPPTSHIPEWVVEGLSRHYRVSLYP